MADRSSPNRGARPRWVFPKGAFADPNVKWVGVIPIGSEADPPETPNRDAIADKPYFAGTGPTTMSTTPAPEADKAAETPGWSFLIGRNASNEVYRVWTYGFEFSVGDAQYFDPGDARRIRLRPLLRSDRRSSSGLLAPKVPWADTDANGLLVVDSPDGAATTVFLVTLFPYCDPEDPTAIERAIEYVRREYGAACPAEMMLLG